MSVQRINHVSDRFEELDKLKINNQGNPSELRRALSQHSPFPPMTGSYTGM